MTWLFPCAAYPDNGGLHLWLDGTMTNNNWDWPDVSKPWPPWSTGSPAYNELKNKVSVKPPYNGLTLVDSYEYDFRIPLCEQVSMVPGIIIKDQFFQI